MCLTSLLEALVLKAALLIALLDSCGHISHLLPPDSVYHEPSSVLQDTEVGDSQPFSCDNPRIPCSSTGSGGMVTL